MRMESPSRNNLSSSFSFSRLSRKVRGMVYPVKELGGIDGPASINRREQWIRAQRARMHPPLLPVSRRNATSLAFLVQVEDTLAWSCARNTRGPDQTLRREKVFELEAHRVNAKEEEKQREKDK